jgi:hypothetical protein
MDFNFRTAGFLTSALHGFILAKHKIEAFASGNREIKR